MASHLVNRQPASPGPQAGDTAVGQKEAPSRRDKNGGTDTRTDLPKITIQTDCAPMDDTHHMTDPMQGNNVDDGGGGKKWDDTRHMTDPMQDNNVDDGGGGKKWDDTRHVTDPMLGNNVEDGGGGKRWDDTHHVTDPMLGGNVDDGGGGRKRRLVVKDAAAPARGLKSLALDGGYAWFVVLGSFLAHVIIGGMERCDGVYFLQFKDKFGYSAQITAWPGALVSSIRLFMGPVAGMVCNRFSVRASCLVGTLIGSLGLFLSGLAPDFAFLFFSHSLLQGLGRGLVYAPSLVVVGLYFNKKIGVATGLSTSGVGVGTFMVVPLSQYLFDTYGYAGAFIITSGMALNLAVSAMLFRPLSSHLKWTRSDIDDKSCKQGAVSDTVSIEDGIFLSNAIESADVHSLRSWQEAHSSNQAVGVKTCNGEGHTSRRDGIIKTWQTKTEGCLKSSFNICFPVDEVTRNESKTKNSKLFEFHLLKNIPFLLFCISIMLFTAAFKSAFTFIPAQVKSLGFSETEAALVLSITGVVDTVGRILVGLLFDRKFAKALRPFIYNGIVFGIALTSFILPTLTDYASICLVCSVYGLLTGGYISQKSVILVDLLGPANIASSFGFLISFQGLGSLIGPPLSGALRDMSGTFHVPFYAGGGMMVCAGISMIASNVFLNIQRTREHQSTNEVEVQVESSETSIR